MSTKYPFFIRTTVILFGIILFVFVLSQLGNILIPLLFAAMLAVLLNPFCNWMMNKKIPKIPAIAISLIIAMTGVLILAYFVSSQLASFSSELPQLKKRGLELFQNLQQTLDKKVGINLDKQNQWLMNAKGKLEPMAGSAVSGLLGILSMLFLLPVYMFLFLYYKTLLINFLYDVFAQENSKEVGVVLSQTKQAIQSYMSGLLIEALVVAVMNCIALMLLGIDYAILVGIICALLNMLPYIGGIIGIMIPVLIATITKDGYTTQLWVVAAYLVIQFIDNNLLMPYIVSSKVKINALMSIIIILLGGALWGISGMFLSVPFIGILKVIFDRVPELKPWGKLFGTEETTKKMGRKKFTAQVA